MFPDALWPNLILFLLGQVAGWCILRSGLVATGIAVLGTLWVAGDLALLLRFILEDEGAGYQACLWVTQLTALGAAGWYFTVRRRATRAAARDSARDEIRAIEVLLLRGDREAATDRLRRLAKRDPWHLAARILLAREHRRRGQAGRSRRLLIGASRIDAGGYADLIRSELGESPATDGTKKGRPRTGDGARSASESSSKGDVPATGRASVAVPSSGEDSGVVAEASTGVTVPAHSRPDGTTG